MVEVTIALLGKFFVYGILILIIDKSNFHKKPYSNYMNLLAIDKEVKTI